MARRNKASVLKRQRERKKAEKAALKREQKLRPEEMEVVSSEPTSDIASREDLEGYGLVVESDEAEAEPEI